MSKKKPLFIAIADGLTAALIFAAFLAFVLFSFPKACHSQTSGYVYADSVCFFSTNQWTLSVKNINSNHILFRFYPGEKMAEYLDAGSVTLNVSGFCPKNLSNLDRIRQVFWYIDNAGLSYTSFIKKYGIKNNGQSYHIYYAAKSAASKFYGAIPPSVFRQILCDSGL